MLGANLAFLHGCISLKLMRFLKDINEGYH